MIEFRPFDESHVALMREWLARPHVAEWWDGVPSLDEIRDEYVGGDQVDAYVAYLDGRPIGFIQSYVAMGSGDGWWENETDPGVRGIDQFIGEADCLDRGIGTALVAAFVARLFADVSVTKVQTDPSVDNARAIRCYQKVGFVRREIIATPDGPEWYMTIDRSQTGPGAAS